MPSWAGLAMDTLWGNALTAIPLALAVAAACRLLPCRPWTRHTLWLLVLGWLVVPPILPRAPIRFATATPSPIREIENKAPAGHPSHSLADGIAPEITDDATPNIGFAESESSAIDHGRSDADASDPASDAMAIHAEPEPIPEKADLASDYLENSRQSGLNLLERMQAPVQKDQTIAVSMLEMGLEMGEEKPDVVAESPPHSEIPAEPPVPVLEPSRPDHLAVIVPEAWWGWLSGLLTLRDALLGLSPIPPAVWLIGLGTVILVRIGFILSFCRRLRAAWPASAAAVTMVREAAASLGLREIPEVAMMRRRVSPMLWCPPRPGRKQIILPAGLWQELDDLGRRAVIFHELAHLRRRDHWVCWLQIIVGSIFWWHPISWWANRRLREEADYCCDAWVTWLLPRGRRAYAEALLRARVHSNEFIVPVPAVGMGVSHSRTHRFARRITMVMTESIKPRFSCAGMVLATAVALAAWVAAPARSCPPKETTPSCKKAPKAPVEAPEPPEVPEPALAPEPPDAPEPAEENTFEDHISRRKAPRAMRSLAPLGRGMVVGAVPGTAPLLAIAGNDDEKPSDIEKRLERLEKQLDRLTKRLDEVGGRPRTPRPESPEPPEPPSENPAPPSPPGAAGRPSEGGTVVRAYAVSKGKLEALIKLMSRPDVPIRVRAAGDKIEVHATETEQQAFRAFVEMIGDAKSEVRSYRVQKGKMEDLAALMTRSDVPILVEPSDDEIRVHGTASQQSVFEGFMNLIDGSRPRRIGTAAPQPQAALIAEELYRAAMERDHAHQEGHAAEAQVRAALERERALAEHQQIRTGSEAIRHHARDMRAHVRKLQREAAALERQAEELNKQAEKLREEAEELRNEAGAFEKPEEGEKLMAKAEQIDVQASVVDSQAEVVREQARSLEQQAETIDEQAEAVEESAEEDHEDEAENEDEAEEESKETPAAK